MANYNNNSPKMTWEVTETLAQVQINDTNRLVVDVNESSTGLVNVGVREFFTVDDGQTWLPGKRGLALKPAVWAKLLPAMQDWLDNQDDDVVNAPVAQAAGRKLAPLPATTTTTARKAPARKLVRSKSSPQQGLAVKKVNDAVRRTRAKTAS